MPSLSPIAGGPVAYDAPSGVATSFNAAISETVTVGSTTTATITVTLSKNIVESANATDSVSAALSTHLGTIVESASASDAQAVAIGHYNATRSDSLNPTDTYTDARHLNQTLTDSGDVEDSLTEFLDNNGAVTPPPVVVPVVTPEPAYSRKPMLPPYLEGDLWEQLVEALDEAFAGNDDARRQLQLTRVPVNTDDPIFTTSRDNHYLTRLEDVEVQEREAIIQSAKILGFNFRGSDLFNPSDYLRISQYIAQYYAETKGTQGWQDFLGFCVNANFQVKCMWTDNYKDFIVEGEPGIGFPVNEGGMWYPTTHVTLEYDPTAFGSLTAKEVTDFFYYFANINLLLQFITLTIQGTMPLLLSMNGYIEVTV